MPEPSATGPENRGQECDLPFSGFMREKNPRNRALIIIGGHEDKERDRLILRAVAARTGDGKLVIVTAASNRQEELADDYESVFRGLGVKHVYKLKIESREDAMSEKSVKILSDTDTVFFTGGDQLKITSQLGLTPVCLRLQEIYDSGGTIAGTSAGASVMSSTMMVGGTDESTMRIGEGLQLAPGLGFIDDVIIDQHFSERGRVGRLIGAVAQNPRALGIGIDENTAILVEGSNRFSVIGEGGVCILDGANMTYSNLTDEEPERALTVFDMKMHVLSQGDRFDCRARRPLSGTADEVEEEILEGAI
jgi:cyanophycinase